MSADELSARGFPADTSSSFSHTFGHASDVYQRWNAWHGAIMQDGAVDSRLKEIVRLRIAQLTECML
jgi:hypothetical protein